MCPPGVCTQANVPSVSSINRILRNRAAERAASEYAKMASQVLQPIYRPWFTAPPALPFPCPFPASPFLKASNTSSRPDSSGPQDLSSHSGSDLQQASETDEKETDGEDGKNRE